MKKLMLILLCGLCSLSLGAWSQSEQQDRMKSCNAEAKSKNLSGEERKKFMSQCLSGTAAQPSAEGKDKPLTAQQQKMKDCNAQAKKQALKGDERKKFMSSCLSKD